jgi:3',5'-cyclic AMP phosphodiesterase CpdA
MKRIVHMSDIHVGFEDLNERFKTAIENLISEKGNQASEYVVVLTGDLVDNAHDADSQKQVKKHIEILKKAGFTDVLVVAGNHDYGTGDHGEKKFVKQFQKIFYGRETPFPKKDIIDHIAFIALDSMAEELNWYDALFSEGELGRKQLEALESLLKSEEVRSCRKRVIYLHHHPFDPRPFHQLKDSGRLKEVLSHCWQEGVAIDAILYGHNHQGKARNGTWAIPRCYDAGTTTLKPCPGFVNWMPWYQVQSSTRDINIENEDVLTDYELDLL